MGRSAADFMAADFTADAVKSGPSAAPFVGGGFFYFIIQRNVCRSGLK